VIVRRAAPGDARAIAQIHIDTWRATYPDIMPPEVLEALDVDERERWWRTWIGAPEITQFVAETDAGVVGFVSVGPCRGSPELGELYAIYVSPQSQGTGAGLALMEAGVATLKEQWDEAILWVATENPRARRFYERYGWVADGERIDDSIPGVSLPEIRYRLSGLGRR
jgi:ribosomal protein S18 acetylase RimI-like enzyme